MLETRMFIKELLVKKIRTFNNIYTLKENY